MAPPMPLRATGSTATAERDAPGAIVVTIDPGPPRPLVTGYTPALSAPARAAERRRWLARQRAAFRLPRQA